MKASNFINQSTYLDFILHIQHTVLLSKPEFVHGRQYEVHSSENFPADDYDIQIFRCIQEVLWHWFSFNITKLTLVSHLTSTGK